MTEWFLAVITPRNSANKPNQVVVGAVNTHTLSYRDTHTHFSLCLLTNSSSLLAWLTNVQLVGGYALPRTSTHGHTKATCEKTTNDKNSQRGESLDVNVGNHA